jgi:DNA-directed RNA polymerase specialized sigma24 family protein
MEQMSDEQLLAASCAGDRLALAQLVERYQATLTGYLDRLVGPDWALMPSNISPYHTFTPS